MTTAQSSTHYPANDELFELTLDGDAPGNDPIQMVRDDDYMYPERWTFDGQKVVGCQTRRFKLVAIGHWCATIDGVREELVRHGRIPNGQWRQAFKAAYPESDEEGPIGVADPSWINFDGKRCIPYIKTTGAAPGFDPVDDYDIHWRWLVTVD